MGLGLKEARGRKRETERDKERQREREREGETKGGRERARRSFRTWQIPCTGKRLVSPRSYDSETLCIGPGLIPG